MLINTTRQEERDIDSIASHSNGRSANIDKLIKIIERIPHRTIVTVKRIEPRGTSKIVKVMMSQWNAEQEVGFPLDLVPKEFHAAVKPGNMLIAEVNIEAAREEDLYFDKFELPNADILKKAKALFVRP